MKKGFTLVEVLAIIIILALVGLIAIPQIGRIIDNSKQTLYEDQIKIIEKAASEYITVKETIYEDQIEKKLSLEELKENGRLKKDDIINPLTEKEFEGCIKYVWKESKNNFDVEYIEPCE